MYLNSQIPSTQNTCITEKVNSLFSAPKHGNSAFLDFILSRDAVIYPASRSGAPIAKLHDARYHIRNREQLVKWWNRNIRRYVFRPSSAHLIGIDCDIRPDCNGIDELSKIVGSDFLSEYPHTTSPRGKHFYFLSDAEYVSTEILPNVEVKGRALITIPGSRSDRGRYTWSGDPANIKPLSQALKKIIPTRNTDPSPAVHTRGNNLELDKIHDILLKQGENYEPGSRNQFVFQFAKFARKQGHSIDAVIEYLKFMITDDFSQGEIVCTAKSAYRGGRHGNN